ncbi:MAG: hypothetical protein P1P86_14545 [Bacteroidales bacterium]|nr:hypothetical protein [Bacteroidales bacterium]
MISPRRWLLKRPGIWIPVFFLSLAHARLAGQVYWLDASAASLGGCYVTSGGYSCANQNQAGLGFIEQSSLSIDHSRPFLIKELGTSSLTGQLITGSGALGIALATRGLKGFRQSSLWISYGMQLYPGISAGAGIHLWHSVLSEQFFHAPGCSFALGLLIRINEHWELGTHLLHPAGWSSSAVSPFRNQLSVAAGCSCSFLRSGCFYSELHFHPEQNFSLCSGLESSLGPRATLKTGIRSEPFTISWGISVKLPGWILEFSFLFRTGSGLSPYTSMTHAW